MIPMFKNRAFNRGKFKEVKVYKPYLKMVCPLDMDEDQVSYGDFFIDFEIDQCRLDDDIIGAVQSENESEADAGDDIESFILAVNYVDDEKNILKTNEMTFSLTFLENGEIMRDDKNQNIKEEMLEAVKKVGDRFRFYEDREINLCIEDLK